MDFALSEEQTAIFDMAYAFGQDAIAPNARQWEKDETIPKDLWPRVGELGFGGLYVSEDGGGTDLSRLDATLVFEALSMACPSVAAGRPGSSSPACTHTGAAGGDCRPRLRAPCCCPPALALALALRPNGVEPASSSSPM